MMLTVTMVAILTPALVLERMSTGMSLHIVVSELPYESTSLVQLALEDSTLFLRDHTIITKHPGQAVNPALLLSQLPDFHSSQISGFYSGLNPLMLAFHAFHESAIISIMAGMHGQCNEHTK